MISKTVMAALYASIPAGCVRTGVCALREGVQKERCYKLKELAEPRERVATGESMRLHTRRPCRHVCLASAPRSTPQLHRVWVILGLPHNPHPFVVFVLQCTCWTMARTLRRRSGCTPSTSTTWSTSGDNPSPRAAQLGMAACCPGAALAWPWRLSNTQALCASTTARLLTI